MGLDSIQYWISLFIVARGLGLTCITGSSDFLPIDKLPRTAVCKNVSRNVRCVVLGDGPPLVFRHRIPPIVGKPSIRVSDRVDDIGIAHRDLTAQDGRQIRYRGSVIRVIAKSPSLILDYAAGWRQWRIGFLATVIEELERSSKSRACSSFFHTVCPSSWSACITAYSRSICASFQ